MKQAFLIVLLLWPVLSKAQLKADAGPDTVVCAGAAAGGSRWGPRVGGLPAASGGVAPYSYYWSVLEQAGGGVDSPYSANPRLSTMAPTFYDSVHFVLQVTDAASNVAYDTVKVLYSVWYVSFRYCIFSKHPMDTVELFISAYSKYLPIHAHWSPGVYLTDSTAPYPGCFAPTGQTYTVTVFDSKGCSAQSSGCRVDVVPLSTSSVSQKAEAAWIAPNPLTAESRLHSGLQWRGGSLHVFSTDGRLLGAKKIVEEQQSLDGILPVASGIYYYSLTSLNGARLYGKLQRD